MGRWQLRSRVYFLFRKIFPVNLIYNKEIKNITDLLAQITIKPTCVLDIGTGIGETLKYLPAGKKRILLDFSSQMLAKAPKSPNDQKIIADCLNLPVKTDCMDLVTCIGVSEYNKQKAVLSREIYSCIKPGGYAIITFSPPGIISKLRTLLGDKIYPLSNSGVKDIFAQQGFFTVAVLESTMQSQYLLKK